MVTNQKLHLTFYLNKQREKNSLFPIYIKLYVDSARAEIATTHFVDPRHWDNDKMKMKSNTPNYVFINGYLENVSNHLNKQFLQAVGAGMFISAKDLKSRFTGKEIVNMTKHKTILEAFDYHNKKMEDLVSIGKVVSKTLTRYKITKNKVEAFMNYQYKVKDKALKDLRLRFVTEFEHYLLTKDKLQSNTAHKYIKNLKKIMTMSVGLDWIPSNPFSNFRCSYSSPDREILTQEELNLLMNKELKIERLKEVRDVFIFCCYTGFAYSDVYKFKQNAVILGLDGNYWLSTNRQKTGTKEKVPLLPLPLEIIEKYKDHDYCVNQNKLLPVKSNQRYNSYLSELADVCGINKHLTTHIARHTFATTVTLSNGVPIETVSAMLGHTNIRTTQIYAKVVEKKMSEDMEILKSKLFAVHRSTKKQG